MWFSADTPVCCDAAQIFSMELQLGQAAGLFKRCSTCLQNFMLGICAMTCAPDHSRFLTPTYDEHNGVGYVSGIEFRIDEDLADNVYDSCKNTILSATGSPVMDIVCPPYNSKTCNAERWYRYLGDPDMNEFVPFRISYNFTIEDEESSFNSSTKSCNEAYPGMYACSCIDCPQSCPAGKVPEAEDEGFIIGEWNGVTFIIGLVVGVVGVATILLTTYFCRDREMPKLNYDFLTGFNEVHDVMGSVFCWWGRLCAKNAILVIAIASWVIGGLCYGITYMEITTDPVELWASETSQTRLDKNYFDSHFGPFYRTNQLFIRPLSDELVMIFELFSKCKDFSENIHIHRFIMKLLTLEQ